MYSMKTKNFCSIPPFWHHRKPSSPQSVFLHVLCSFYITNEIFLFVGWECPVLSWNKQCSFASVGSTAIGEVNFVARAFRWGSNLLLNVGLSVGGAMLGWFLSNACFWTMLARLWKGGYISLLFCAYVATSFSHLDLIDPGILCTIGVMAMGNFRKARPGMLSTWLSTSAKSWSFCRLLSSKLAASRNLSKRVFVITAVLPKRLSSSDHKPSRSFVGFAWCRLRKLSTTRWASPL